ncbi:MAG: glycosyltransferase [Ignavibacteriaceae bacterium]
MKIVYLGKFNNQSVLSGPEKYSINLFNFISTNMETVFIEYYFKSYRNSSIFTRLFGKETISGLPNVTRLGSIRILLYLIKYNPGIIHILTAERYTIPVYLYKRLLKGKIITTFHSVLRFEIPNDIIRRKKTGRFKDYIWEKFAIKFSDKLIFLSKQHIELAKKFYDFVDNKTAIIPHGVESEFYNPDKIMNIDESFNIVFYDGINDSIERGLDWIVSELNKLNLKRIKFYIIGSTKKIINANFYYEFVSPMGKGDLINFLKDKQILLKSNVYDSFSIFTLECMTAGLIVIVPEKVGLSSYVNNGENGFLYECENTNQLETIMVGVLNQKYDLHKISINASKIYFKLEWRIIKSMYLNYYKNIK